jgi:uncharacterized protein YqgV (UPF0045/DUF77 family)
MQTTWYLSVVLTIGIKLLAIILYKLVEAIKKMFETRFENAIKRVVTVTLIDSDVDRIESILQAFINKNHKAHKDRRLLGFAKRFVDRIETQRQQVKILENEDRKEAMARHIEMLEKEKAEAEAHMGDRILELTDVLEDDSYKDTFDGDESVVDDSKIEGHL